jgi:hypothetical protein
MGVWTLLHLPHFAMFTLVGRLCVLAVQIVEVELYKVYKLCYWHQPLCSKLLIYGPFPNEEWHTPSYCFMG